MVNDSGQVLSRKETSTDTESYANGLATVASILVCPQRRFLCEAFDQQCYVALADAAVLGSNV
jgi:hypothetical protein